jgi:3-deoxy-manno-octulosonate cytidylyltransferase (CMP-KDO synthetase)
MPVLVVIPARLGSTRLPRKLLQPLGGVPLIVRVAERVHSFELADRLVVATDSPEILQVAGQAGFDVTLTSPCHPSGTDRVYEVAARPEFAGFDAILNVQGDAPFLPRAAAAGALEQLARGFAVGTAAVPLGPGDGDDPGCVKVLIGGRGEARGFSRLPIAGGVNWRHLGVYGYTRPALERITRAAPTRAERAEGLEQLRALALGLAVGVARLDEPAGPAVDTPADLEEAQAHWTLLHEVTR